MIFRNWKDTMCCVPYRVCKYVLFKETYILRMHSDKVPISRQFMICLCLKFLTLTRCAIYLSTCWACGLPYRDPLSSSPIKYNKTMQPEDLRHPIIHNISTKSIQSHRNILFIVKEGWIMGKIRSCGFLCISQIRMILIGLFWVRLSKD